MLLRLKLIQKTCITNSSEIFDLLGHILRHKSSIDRNREHLWTIGLDNQNRVLYIEQVSVGSINSVIAHPMEVYCMAVRKRAVSVVLVHNHCSSPIEPSKEDIRITQKLATAGHILNIRLLDHLIITTDSYYSFADEGLLEDELTLSRRCIKLPIHRPGFFPYRPGFSGIWKMNGIINDRIRDAGRSFSYMVTTNGRFHSCYFEAVS